MKRLLYPLFFLVLGWEGGALRAQNVYFPPSIGTWETLSPDSLGWCADSLAGLQDFLGERGTKAFIVLKDGRMVVEWYYDTFTADSVWFWASAGKTLMATLVGIAQQEGTLDIHQPSSDFLGQGWTSCDSTQEDSITIWHQLTMTSGMDEGPDIGECTDDTCLTCIAAPGTRWSYHNGPYTLLREVVEAATNRTINQYFLSRIGLPIGMSGSFFRTGYNNVFFSRPRDMARFGLLMLAEGMWNGTPILSDTAYYQEMITPSQALNPSYGYLWWLNGQGSHMLPVLDVVFPGDLIPSAPSDLFAALGSQDQKIYIVPSQGLVAIRMGTSAGQLQPSLSGFDNELWEKMEGLQDSCTMATRITTARSLIHLHPNPATTYFKVSGSVTLFQAVAFDTRGRRYHLSLTDDRTVSLAGLPPGLYTLNLTDIKGVIYRERLLKQ